VTTTKERHRASGGTVVRRWQDGALALVALALLVLSAVPVDAHHISSAERGVFRLVNDHTVLPFTPVWALMQLGNILVVPVAALIAAATRRWRLAIGILVGGLATYYLAKVVKSLVTRGRPADLVDDVSIRGAAALGRGYVSGHAAVVTLLVVLAWAYLGNRGRILAVSVAAFVCLARMYVGAHLPLDIVGGVALGLGVAAEVRLILGRPAP
jgi:undecaprenyl-diphosphatase